MLPRQAFMRHHHHVPTVTTTAMRPSLIFFNRTGCRIRTDIHVVQTTVHHAIIDGWSVQVVYRELAELYNAAKKGHTPSLSKLPIQVTLSSPFVSYAAACVKQGPQGAQQAMVM